MVGADRELVLGEDHPVRGDAAQLRLLELRAVGHDGPGPRDRDALPRGDVRRPADDLCLHAVADLHRADGQPVGVGVGRGLQHAPDDERVEVADAVMVDAIDLGAGHRQSLGEVARIQTGVAVSAQPFDADPHPNCSRKRTSLS